MHFPRICSLFYFGASSNPVPFFGARLFLGQDLFNKSYVQEARALFWPGLLEPLFLTSRSGGCWL